MLTNEQLIILADEMEAANMATGPDYPAIAASINAPGEPVPNPNPQQDVPAPFTFDDIVFAIVTDDDWNTFWSQPASLLNLIEARANSQDREGLRTYLGRIRNISQATKDAWNAILDAMIPDPSWTATIPGPSLATEWSLPPVEAVDIQAIDNGLYGAALLASLEAASQ